MTLQLTPALEQRLELLASETQSSTDDLAQYAVESFVSDQEEMIAAVKEADEEFERGDSISHEDVVAHFKKRFAKA